MIRCSLLALALLAALPALAATPINQTRPLAADGQVRIDNLKGRVSVRTWDQPQVRITGSLGKGVEKLVIEGNGRDLRIEVRYPKGGGGWFGWWSDDSRSEPTLIEVTLPASAAVDVDTVSADIDIQGVRGRRLTAESVSGDVDVADSRPGEVRLESVSGDLRAVLDGNNVSAESVSGDVRLQGRIGGRVSVGTVSGNGVVSVGAVDRLEFSSVSGDGQLELGLAANGTLRGETVSGDLSVLLPQATSARLSAETFSGSISAPVGRVIKEEHGPGSRLDARMGAGAGDVRLESFSGDIRVKTR